MAKGRAAGGLALVCASVAGGLLGWALRPEDHPLLRKFALWGALLCLIAAVVVFLWPTIMRKVGPRDALPIRVEIKSLGGAWANSLLTPPIQFADDCWVFRMETLIVNESYDSSVSLDFAIQYQRTDGQSVIVSYNMLRNVVPYGPEALRAPLVVA
ncbi:MAG: hypothetical protein AB1551_08680, partial [Actinomycetota bacterium]